VHLNKKVRRTSATEAKS